MKRITFLLTALVVCLAFQGMAQEITTHILRADNATTPLLLLKADNRCLEIDSAKNITMDSIDPNTIESIEVFKDKQETTDLYGLKARAGVIVIHFKEFDLLSKELQSKFKECK